jgi:hypothetical protein
MKFLETITGWGDDTLVPINRIKRISFHILNEAKFEITIFCDEGEHVECFQDEDKATARYEQIKKIIEAE